MQKNAYIQHQGKVIETSDKFKYVMAIALDSSTSFKEGVIRCITSREGNVEISGYIDRSELYRVSVGTSFDHIRMNSRLIIKNEDKVTNKLNSWNGMSLDFIGLEDPDLFYDEDEKLLHLYFTMPFLDRSRKHALIHLGHAVGKSLESLEMTAPVLLAKPKTFEGAKELSVAPVNSKGFRYNLVESSKKETDFTYSTVRVAIAEDLNGPWKFGETVFHPKEHSISWIGGHASPGPLLPRSFIDIGPNKLVGIINGREANGRVGTHIKYGMFSVGLFIYDYENGKIDWVSPQPLIRDTEAVTITFASQFIETKSGEGILYAHVDDSFVRAYTLYAEGIKQFLPILK